MNKKTKIIVSVLKIALIVGIVFTISINSFNNSQYSSDISKTKAQSIINLVKYTNDEESFDHWDLQKIDDELFLASYSDNPVTDVFDTDRSWIVYDNQIVYETSHGILVLGKNLDRNIAKKFNHNIQTYEEKSSVENIEFETTEIKSNRVPQGTQSIISPGELGSKSITKQTLFVNGVQSDIQVIEKVTKDPVDAVVLVGTYEEPPTNTPPTLENTLGNSNEVDAIRKLTWFNNGYNADGSAASWAFNRYGNYSFMTTGSTSTALAIAFSGYGVHTTPEVIGEWLYTNGYYNNTYVGVGGHGIVFATESFELEARGLSSESEVSAALNKGNIVIATIQSEQFGMSGFTQTLVLNGYRNGKTYVINPNYANKSGLSSISSLWSHQSRDQIDGELGFVFYEIIGNGIVELEEITEEPPSIGHDVISLEKSDNSVKSHDDFKEENENTRSDDLE